MSYTIKDVAEYYLKIVDRESGSSITPLKLQKILYYTQGFYLALHETELFPEEFQAWTHGPANPQIYDTYKIYGYSAISEPEDYENPFDVDTIKFLNNVWETFGIYDAKYLEELTHQETPWILARGNCKPGEKCTNIITKESMKDFFKQKLNVV